MAPLVWCLAALASGVEPTFSAGSYGRVTLSSDLQGGGGDAVTIASHGPRLELDPYMELDLAWELATEADARFGAVVTPAISGDLFHYDGVFGEQIALRNFYAYGDDLFSGVPLGVWAGSRMYRGDDVYLLDFWPLDNLNTVGGGVTFAPGPLGLAVHVGANRLRGDDYQVQEATVAAPGAVAGEQVLVLDRQRTVGSARASAHVELGPITLRGKVYGEIHRLPAGERLLDGVFEELQLEALPDDRGSLIGVQLSAWGWAPQSFVHLWIRRSTGLAAYGELAIPSDGLALDYRAAAARSWMVAVAGNTETDVLGVMAGAYASTFVDADGQQTDFDDRLELVGSVRPQVYVAGVVALGVELSHQAVRPNGLNPRSGELDRPDVTKLSVLPAVQWGPGGFTRPRVHAVYTATFLDADARQLYAPLDARSERRVRHLVGIGAEWWVNSRRVITPQ